MGNREQATTRPVGWWLKEADALLDAAFDAALDGTGVDRRGWQVLATLAANPVERSALLDALASFDPPEVLGGTVGDALRRGWVEEAGGVLRLTNAGSAQHRALRPRVGQVREKVAASLPPEDYARLVGLLARLVGGLRPAP